MKIIYISEYFPYENFDDISGGVEARCLNLAREISKKHEVVIVTSWKKGQKRNHNFDKIKVFRVGPNHEYSNNGSIISRLKFAIAAYNFSKKLNADIVEGYSFISYLPAYFSAKIQGAKAIATYHEVWLGEWIKNKGLVTGLFGSIWEKIVLSLEWDRFISVSNFTSNRLIVNNINKNKIEIIPNGIKLSDYKVSKNKFKNLTICSLSRLTPHKRISDLIRAVYLVKRKFPNIKVYIIGKGPEYFNLIKLVKNLKLEKTIIFKGFLKNRKEVTNILSKSHIFCLPSILEGFGIVILEAMASGTPYICSDIKVLKETTNGEKGGLIFRKKNYKDLAKKINILLDNKKLYLEKQKEQKNEIIKYDWSTISKSLEQIYTK